MKLLINKYCVMIIIFCCLVVVFGFLSLISQNKSYFLRDDYDILLVAKDFSLNKLFLPHGEHFYPISRLLFQVQYELFKLNFTSYINISICFHLINIVLVYSMINYLTRRSNLALLGAVSFAVPGASYKILVMIANQTWILEATFSALCLLFLCQLFKSNKRNLHYFLMSILMAIFASLTYTTGFAVLAVVFTSGLFFFRKQKKIVLSLAFVWLFFLLLYLLIPHQLSGNLIKDVSLLLYPLLVFRLIIFGFLFGGILQTIFPWFVLIRSLPVFQIYFSFALLFLILIFVKTIKDKHKSLCLRKNIKDTYFLIIALLFIVFHYGIIGLGRYSNLGFSVSPQYNYLPRLIIIILIFSYGYKWLKKTQTKKALTMTFLLLICLWITANQTSYLIFELKRWESRGVFTKNFITDLQYIFYHQKPVLDLYLPESINPKIKYSQIKELFNPETKVDFVDGINTNVLIYLSSISDKRIYNFYQKAIAKYDIKHY